MARSRAYFDYNAGAPLRPAARDAMVEALAATGNASSAHAEGRAARARIEDARAAVADLVGAEPRNVTFVGGGTEANVTALSPRLMVEGKPVELAGLLVGATEHLSVLAGQANHGVDFAASLATQPHDRRHFDGLGPSSENQ